MGTSRKISINKARQIALDTMKMIKEERREERYASIRPKNRDDFIPGDMAYCDNGLLGLITGSKFILEKGFRKRVYIGISLEKDSIGKPWQSVDPVWDGFILDYI